MIIAIDGPAASGKGTLGKRLAAHYGLRHLDTGLLYRAVAQAVRADGYRLDDPIRAAAAAQAIDPGVFDEIALKSHEAGEAASIVSAIPEVRAALLALQRGFAGTPPGAVLDGRDIGTVICPDAAVKIYVTATPEVRARRRMLEMRSQGKAADEAAILADIRRRDERDTARAVAPLEPARGCPYPRYFGACHRGGGRARQSRSSRPPVRADGRNRRRRANRRDALHCGHRRPADPQLFCPVAPHPLPGHGRSAISARPGPPF